MKVKIAYSDRQSAKKNDSFSPSATKPALFMKAIKKLDNFSFDHYEVKPASRADIATVHDKKMVNRILDLKQSNGFSNKLKDVADALPWVCGSMITAVNEVVEHGGVCFSPTSGAHHAGYNFTGGFCTFNFLAMAAKHVNFEYGVKVGILDCDAHFGNGTQDIIDHFGWKWVHHHSMGDKYGKHRTYLAHLKTALLGFNGIDVMIYNAGADPHENDPLGGMLSTSELAERDNLVLNWCRERNIPVAISLAGGYQDKIEEVIKVHVNTFKIAHDLWADALDLGDVLWTEKVTEMNDDGPSEQYLLDFTESEWVHHEADFLSGINDLIELYEPEMSVPEMIAHLEIYLQSLKNRP